MVAKIHHVKASADLLDKVMCLPLDRDPEMDYLILENDTGRLHASALKFVYPNSEMVSIDIPSLQINEGERVAILGRTGSGKSTLLRLLSGLYPPSDGRIYFDNIDIQHIDPIRYRKMVGYLPQDVRLFAGTLRDNLLLGAGVVEDSRLLEVCKVAGLSRLIVQHPLGLNLPIFEGGGGLSGGQRQAVGLARLILANPGIYLLDEPTASMDDVTESEFIAQINSHISTTSTLVVVTHKASVLALVDRVLVIDQGRLVMDGPRDQVLSLLMTGNKQAPAGVGPRPVVATTA